MEDLYRRVSDRQTMGSVVQELRASLSEIEKHIDQFFRNPVQREVLIPVPAQLSSMRGVLSVLGHGPGVARRGAHARRRRRDDRRRRRARAPQGGAFDRLADNLGALGFLIDMLSVQPQMAKSLFRFDAASGQLESVMDRAHRPSVFGALDGVPAFERELVEKAGEIAKSAAASEADAGDVARDLEKLARQAEAADQRSIATAADKAQRALKGAESGDERKEALAQAAKVMTELVKPHVDAQASKPAPLKPLPPPAVAAPPVPPGQTGLEDDTEMRDIFLEEAREVMQTAREALAQLAKTPNDLERDDLGASRLPHAEGQLAHGRAERLRRSRVGLRAAVQHASGRRRRRRYRSARLQRRGARLPRPTGSKALPAARPPDSTIAWSAAPPMRCAMSVAAFR